jgi:hypothetical protein
MLWKLLTFSIVSDKLYLYLIHKPGPDLELLHTPHDQSKNIKDEIWHRNKCPPPHPIYLMIQAYIINLVKIIYQIIAHGTYSKYFPFFWLRKKIAVFISAYLNLWSQMVGDNRSWDLNLCKLESTYHNKSD